MGGEQSAQRRPGRRDSQRATDDRAPRGMWQFPNIPLRWLVLCIVLCIVGAIVLAVGVSAATVDAAGAYPHANTRPATPVHALPVKESPAQNAVLKAPPGEVCIWFSEPLNPATSHLVVVDPTNHEVDKGDSHVEGDNSEQMCVTMQLVPAGTYVVAWRSQSAVDGHVVGGSYLFRIARPDGTVPSVPTKLPTGHFPGAGGTSSGSGSTLDAPSTLQAVGTWLAYIFLAFWLGGLIWETWILPPNGQGDPDLDAAARHATGRFFTLAPYALLGVLVADVLIVLGETSELAGGLSGMADPALLHAVLFGSQFGTFWWCREVVALASLGLLWLVTRQGWQRRHEGEAIPAPKAAAQNEEAHHLLPVVDWRREFAHVWRGVPHIPRRLVSGTRQRTLLGIAELLLGLALLVAFALSGHAAAVPASQLPYVLIIDLIHLIATATWVGGLLYISLVLVPALGDLSPRQRARVLALGLPEFSALAIVSAVALAVTGILNTTVHLSSASQFLTTTYGRILAVKIEIFLVMVAISFYHAFVLRPRLATTLAHATASEEQRGIREDATLRALPEDIRAAARSGTLTITASGVRKTPLPTDGHSQTRAPEDDDSHNRPPRPPLAPREDAASLAQRMENWLRREAWLGIAVLLCVALLAAFAGTLATTPASATLSQSGPYMATQTAGSYSVHIDVTPDTFGSNTFTVMVTSAQGNTPVTGAAVIVQTTMLDMDMGTQSVQLKAVDGKPGTYAVASELTMAGHWAALVKVLPPNSNTFVSTTFKFVAAQG